MLFRSREKGNAYDTESFLPNSLLTAQTYHKLYRLETQGEMMCLQEEFFAHFISWKVSVSGAIWGFLEMENENDPFYPGAILSRQHKSMGGTALGRFSTRCHNLQILQPPPRSQLK